MNKLIARPVAVLATAVILLLSACGPAATAVPAAPATTQPARATATSLAVSTATTTGNPPASVFPTQVAAATATQAATSVPVGLPDSGATPAGTIVATTVPPQDAKNAVKGQPTRIVLPALRVDSKVIPVGWTTVIQGNQLVSDWETADFAVGFHFTSAPPGTVGNTVMSGHNNINGMVFRDLDMLKVGDKISVYAGDKLFQYAVSQTMIVAEKFAGAEQQRQNAQWMAPTNDNRLTLISCWPRTNNTHRVIVVAKPV